MKAVPKRYIEFILVVQNKSGWMEKGGKRKGGRGRRSGRRSGGGRRSCRNRDKFLNFLDIICDKRILLIIFIFHFVLISAYCFCENKVCLFTKICSTWHSFLAHQIRPKNKMKWHSFVFCIVEDLFRWILWYCISIMKRGANLCHFLVRGSLSPFLNQK